MSPRADGAAGALCRACRLVRLGALGLAAGALLALAWRLTGWGWVDGLGVPVAVCALAGAHVLGWLR